MKMQEILCKCSSSAKVASVLKSSNYLRDEKKSKLTSVNPLQHQLSLRGRVAILQDFLLLADRANL